MKQYAIKCLWEVGATLGECPIWSEEYDSLFFVDIQSQVLYWIKDDGTKGKLDLPAKIASIALCKDGRFLGAFDRGLALFTLDNNQLNYFSCPENHIQNNRLNDGKCDALGRFWVASMDVHEIQPSGNIWRVDSNYNVSHIRGGFVVGNGFGWSPDNQVMYFTDSHNRIIYKYCFDLYAGKIERPAIFARIPADQGYPDGLCVDREGCVWSAHWDGWRITRYSPNGAIDMVLPMPVPRPTSLTFGGKNLNKLYVTSAQNSHKSTTPATAGLSGNLFEIDIEAVGLPENPFAG